MKIWRKQELEKSGKYPYTMPDGSPLNSKFKKQILDKSKHEKPDNNNPKQYNTSELRISPSTM